MNSLKISLWWSLYIKQFSKILKCIVWKTEFLEKNLDFAFKNSLANIVVIATPHPTSVIFGTARNWNAVRLFVFDVLVESIEIELNNFKISLSFLGLLSFCSHFLSSL